MAKASAILALVGAIVAAVISLLVLDILLIVPAGFAVVAGIYIALQQKENMLVLVSGAIAAILGLVAILGVTMTFLSPSVATALTIVANLEIVASALKTAWNEMPKAGAIVAAVALGLAALLALVFNSSLGDFFAPWTFIVAVLSLVGVYPAAIAMRE